MTATQRYLIQNIDIHAKMAVSPTSKVSSILVDRELRALEPDRHDSVVAQEALDFVRVADDRVMAVPRMAR